MFTPDEATNNPADPDNHSEHMFCTDMACPCHEDEDEVALLGEFYREGEVSVEDADRIYHGRTI